MFSQFDENPSVGVVMGVGTVSVLIMVVTAGSAKSATQEDGWIMFHKIPFIGHSGLGKRKDESKFIKKVI